MASRYPLNLPADLKQELMKLAKQQGISLNQFILWTMAEKAATMRASLSDPKFPNIVYRKGALGVVTPVIKGTGIRVQTVVIGHKTWGEPLERIATDYEIPLELVKSAWEYYLSHTTEIEALIKIDADLEAEHDKAKTSPGQ